MHGFKRLWAWNTLSLCGQPRRRIVFNSVTFSLQLSVTLPRSAFSQNSYCIEKRSCHISIQSPRVSWPRCGWLCFFLPTHLRFLPVITALCGGEIKTYSVQLQLICPQEIVLCIRTQTFTSPVFIFPLCQCFRPINVQIRIRYKYITYPFWSEAAAYEHVMFPCSYSLVALIITQAPSSMSFVPRDGIGRNCASVGGRPSVRRIWCKSLLCSSNLKRHWWVLFLGGGHVSDVISDVDIVWSRARCRPAFTITHMRDGPVLRNHLNMLDCAFSSGSFYRLLK